MGVVRFYACAGDPVGVAARLVRKAHEQGDRLWVCADPALLDRLGQQLWMGDGFVAHAPWQASASVRRHSRIEFADDAPARAVPLLLNLQGWLAPDRASADKVFDVFGSEEHERQAARQRFRWYQQAGLEPETVRVGAA